MMELELGQDVDAVLVPWDFTVRTEAGSFQTRPPLLGELAVLDQFGARKDGKAVVALAKVVATIQGLFVDAPADLVANWGSQRLQKFVMAYADYFFSHTKKNDQARDARTGAQKKDGSGKL